MFEVCSLDRTVLADDFGPETLPQNMKWLLRHFRTEESIAFAVYCLKMRGLRVFGLKYLLDGFCDHTGRICSRSKRIRWYKLLARLEEAAQKAQDCMDLDTLSRLKLGLAKELR